MRLDQLSVAKLGRVATFVVLGCVAPLTSTCSARVRRQGVMDPMRGLPRKYAGRLPRVRPGPAPCAAELTSMLSCYMDNNFVNSGKCVELTREFEQCKATIKVRAFCFACWLCLNL